MRVEIRDLLNLPFLQSAQVIHVGIFVEQIGWVPVRDSFGIDFLYFVELCLRHIVFPVSAFGTVKMSFDRHLINNVELPLRVALAAFALDFALDSLAFRVIAGVPVDYSSSAR